MDIINNSVWVGVKTGILCIPQEEGWVFFPLLFLVQKVHFYNIAFIAISQNAEKLNDTVHTWFGFILLNMLNIIFLFRMLSLR